jgi:uncharacterized protein YndB with AHSA1/START domain
MSPALKPPVARTEMLIRRPVAEVFEAFVDPAVTSRFWFTKGSNRLGPGKKVRWEWEMYGFSVDVEVKAFEENRRILVEWSALGPPTTIEWVFTARPDDTTFVSITNAGFSGDGDEVVQQAIQSTEGFTFVLAGLKALLEHGIRLNLVPDRFPDGVGWGAIGIYRQRRRERRVGTRTASSGSPRSKPPLESAAADRSKSGASSACRDASSFAMPSHTR